MKTHYHLSQSIKTKSNYINTI